MARISAKRQLLEEQQRLLEEQTLQKNSFDCANFLMQRMELEVDDKTGFLARYNEDTEELSEIIFDGKKCKDLRAPIDPRKEMPFDPYNNIKLCCGLLQYYVNEYMGKDTQIMYLSNKTSNDEGTLTLVFENGQSVIGNPYNKDTLKYIDMIVLLDGGNAIDNRTIKGMDVNANTFKR